MILSTLLPTGMLSKFIFIFSTSPPPINLHETKSKCELRESSFVLVIAWEFFEHCLTLNKCQSERNFLDWILETFGMWLASSRHRICKSSGDKIYHILCRSQSCSDRAELWTWIPFLWRSLTSRSHSITINSQIPTDLKKEN